MLVFNPFALSLNADGTYTSFSSDAWTFAGETTLLGMGMIFAVLSILWGVLAIFKVVFAGKSPKAPKKKAQKKTSVSEEKQDDAVGTGIAASIPSYEADKAQDDTAIVAILTAAIAAYRASEEGTNGSFRVVSFKRVGKGAWNSGR